MTISSRIAPSATTSFGSPGADTGYFRRMAQGPLAHLRVVETASILAGPSVGTFLAELGAQVIKVENARTGGDVTRQWKLPAEPVEAPVSAYFSSVNHGKQHLLLDLQSPEGQARCRSLVDEADVLISNHLPAAAAKLGLDAQGLRRSNARLVHGHIIGYRDAPARPAFDVVLQAECGYISMTGLAPGALAKMPVAMIDVLAAHQLKEGILVALMQRERTGRGAYVEVSLEDAALAGLVNQASNHLMTGHVPGPVGTLHPNIAPYGELFTCSDGLQLVLAVGNDDAFGRLCGLLDLYGVAGDTRFATNTDRVRNRTALAAKLAPAMALYTRETLLVSMAHHGVPAGAVRSLNEVLSTPAARALVVHEIMDGVPTERLRSNVFRIAPQ